MTHWLEVERIAMPSRERFEREYVARGRPVVITGMLDPASAGAHFAPDSLARRAGDVVLPHIATDGGVLRHDAATGLAYGSTSLAEFARRVSAHEDAAGYLTAALDEDLPDLAREVPMFALADGARWTRRRFWFAPEGAGSPLHRDLPENLYAQLHGAKRFHLVPRTELRSVYPFAWYSGLPNFAAADAERPDYGRHPRFRRAPRTFVDLRPGDVLYLPRLVWHQTRALSTSVSVNLWFATGRMATALLRTAELYKRVRGLRI